MKTAILAVFALSLMATAALTRTSSGTSSSGSSSTSGSTTPGTASPGGGGIGRGAPALTPRPSGPATPNRSNTDLFPPSQLLPSTQGAVSTQQTQNFRQHEHRYTVGERHGHHRSVHDTRWQILLQKSGPRLVRVSTITPFLPLAARERTASTTHWH